MRSSLGRQEEQQHLSWKTTRLLPVCLMKRLTKPKTDDLGRRHTGVMAILFWGGGAVQAREERESLGRNVTQGLRSSGTHRE